MSRLVEAIIRLRRDNDYNFERIKDTFIPANGEVILVDTARDGLRAKVGDGFSTYAQLDFTDADLRNAALQGYYENGVMYIDVTKQTPFPMMINKIYIDKTTSNIYYYNGEQYLPAGGGNIQIPNANSTTAGIMKLYSTVGQNTDGTMTQKSITDELNLRSKMDINSQEELLIFE